MTPLELFSMIFSIRWFQSNWFIWILIFISNETSIDLVYFEFNEMYLQKRKRKENVRIFMDQSCIVVVVVVSIDPSEIENRLKKNKTTKRFLPKRWRHLTRDSMVIEWFVHLKSRKKTLRKRKTNNVEKIFNELGNWIALVNVDELGKVTMYCTSLTFSFFLWVFVASSLGTISMRKS